MNDLVAELPTASSTGVSYRSALASDSGAVAPLFCLAGGGLYEFLFDDLSPSFTAEDILAAGIAADATPISYRNCHVAVDAAGAVVGVANAFPADLVGQQGPAFLPHDRRSHVRPILLVQDWGSMFLNVLAVCDGWHGRGVGTRLLAWAERQARSAGFNRLSLHVWADNATAREFYRARGFLERGVAEMASHPRLLHRGGSILMSKPLPPA
jgi:GNAT superfamily N-acetyltransferase